MAGGIIYLDIDDEITSAASRIRAAEGRRVAVVLPYGSRVATSRINFRLLSRDALTHEKRLSIIANDAATRALAASAGLPVFASVAEYENSEEAPRTRGPVPPAPDDESNGSDGTDDPDRSTAAGAAAAAAAAAALAGDTARVPVPPAGGRKRGKAAQPPADAPQQATLDEMEAAELAAAARSIETVTPPLPEPVPVPAPVRREPATATRPDADSLRGGGPARGVGPVPAASGGVRTRTPMLVGAGVLALVLLVGLVGAYLVLPSASIVVTPKVESVGPVVMTIVADPSAEAPDPAAQPPVVPAEIVTVDVAANATFPATGKRVVKAKATGVVRFRNKDFTSSNTIPGGSVVSTANGIKFRTNATVTVPRADIVGLQIFPKTATVRVTAVKDGTDGNVEPNTIVVIPKGEDPVSLDVNNPDATKGGKRDEFPKVTQEDIDKALAALQPQLEAAFLDRLADPTVASPGATVFPDTRVLGTGTPTVDPATLVDQEVESFDLGLTASGTATAVDAAPVATVAEELLTSGIDPGHRLVQGSIDVQVDPAVVSNGQISFPATASASQTAILDPAALKTLVMGKKLDDARSLLGAYGTVELTPWPDWVSTVPTLDGRVDVTVNDAIPFETPPPSEGP